MDFVCEEAEPMTPRPRPHLHVHVQTQASLCEISARTAPRTIVVFSEIFPDGHVLAQPIKVQFVTRKKIK
jgi:hypothetical protein